MIQRRPRSSKVMAMGLTMSGSLATSSTVKPSGTVIFLMASAGDSGGPGIWSWPCGIGSAFGGRLVGGGRQHGPAGGGQGRGGDG